MTAFEQAISAVVGQQWVDSSGSFPGHERLLTAFRSLSWRRPNSAIGQQQPLVTARFIAIRCRERWRHRDYRKVAVSQRGFDASPPDATLPNMLRG